MIKRWRGLSHLYFKSMRQAHADIHTRAVWMSLPRENIVANTYTQTHMHTHAHAHKQGHTYTCTCMHTHSCTHGCKHTHVHTHRHTCTCMRTHKYTTHTHTSMHTRKHTNTQSLWKPLHIVSSILAACGWTMLGSYTSTVYGLEWCRVMCEVILWAALATASMQQCLANLSLFKVMCFDKQI